MTEVPIEAVVIGASAGAVQALTYILPALPEDYRLPVLVVVHVPSDRHNMLVPHFQAKCRVQVREAEDKEPICRSVIYFAPPDYHFLVEIDRTIALSVDAAVLFRALPSTCCSRAPRMSTGRPLRASFSRAPIRTELRV